MRAYAVRLLRLRRIEFSVHTGVHGAILAVPMLAILKIICDRLRPLKALGHFLEGE